MEIKELIKLCSEYQNLSVKKELYEYEIEANKKYPHLGWAIERDTLLLFKIVNRKQEIQEILTDMQEIKF